MHPFSASLWRQAVCLPCILYRVNSLLLANFIRSVVASQVHGLGVVEVPDGFRWETMSFGWSLQEVFGIDQSKTTTTDSVKILSGKAEIDKKATGVVVAENVQPDGELYAPIALPPPLAPEPKPQLDMKSTTQNTKLNEVKPKRSKQPDGELKISKQTEGNAPKKEEKELSGFEKAAKEDKPAGVTFAESLLLNDKTHVG